MKPLRKREGLRLASRILSGRRCPIKFDGYGATRLIGEEEGRRLKLIDVADDDSAKAVEGDIDAHRKVWAAKTDEERTTLRQSAAVSATRQAGHRGTCPACESRALVNGELFPCLCRKLMAERSR